MMSRQKLFLSLLATAVFLSGCGIKPNHVAAPQGEDKDTFPHTYPHAPTPPETKDSK